MIVVFSIILFHCAIIMINVIFFSDFPCPPHQHSCDRGLTEDGWGRCLDVSHMCDGSRDCVDLSDELGCDASCKQRCL